jgi:outer membrane lipoprotein-sorting protein
MRDLAESIYAIKIDNVNISDSFISDGQTVMVYNPSIRDTHSII